MFQDITIEKLLDLKDKKDFTLVDVRSPAEFAENTIPGSINIPLFNNEERAEIGTIYKQVSVDAAKARGVEIVSAKLPEFVRAFQELSRDVVVFCWRGGMRSKTSATLIDLMGVHAFRLQGGIRSYRQWTVSQIESLEIKQEAIVLNGYTGSNKTKILLQLASEGYPVIDLEGLANHRGSIFGQIGKHAHNQKTFDSLLIHHLEKLKGSSYLLMEAESKRIGKVVIPEPLLKRKEAGIQIFLHMPIEERVKHILEDYEPWEHHQECLEAFQLIKRRIHTPIAASIEDHLINKNYEQAVYLLLEYYYDPLYERKAKLYGEERTIILTAQNTETAVLAIKKALAKNAVKSY
ncbi:tRNA 2-selenouridine(34) synthase MnmH [Niallia taxi]|uniref:tRNA 2-selenouridine(34) synthase MnmH n=1 Tax=Niallia taxi TaxID=2499688 RepID=UPI001247117B|nr:tRNA 2-selenouridine(34) synthase MnmH [Niallia taxi]MDK8643681.1 tRNA 2-selenouridine(34) synthase MnmH [Niallia taxi]MED4056828.1 tRNA 2-selenouridine(34) synthase MnmH [Niallia taxi]MED4121712.1 tRNA 2-selenouridine(34) synthase MnmH [Niallia taxi]